MLSSKNRNGSSPFLFYFGMLPMAQKFSKSFYNSIQWKTVREHVMIRDKWICRKCGKPAEDVHHITHLNPNNIYDRDINLNPDNLIALCKDCHFGIHKAERIENLMQWNKRKRVWILDKNGCYFDEKGYLMKRKVIVVYGSPRSGKTTYVNQNKDETDMVVDVDALISAVQGHFNRRIANNLLYIALDIRDFLFEQIEKGNRNVDCKTVWIVGGFPTKREREDLLHRFGCKFVFIDTDQETCVERSLNDNLYGDSEYSEYIVRDWWRRYER